MIFERYADSELHVWCTLLRCKLCHKFPEAFVINSIAICSNWKPDCNFNNMIMMFTLWFHDKLLNYLIFSIWIPHQNKFEKHCGSNKNKLVADAIHYIVFIDLITQFISFLPLLQHNSGNQHILFRNSVDNHQCKSTHRPSRRIRLEPVNNCILCTWNIVYENIYLVLATPHRNTSSCMPDITFSLEQ